MADDLTGDFRLYFLKRNNVSVRFQHLFFQFQIFILTERCYGVGLFSCGIKFQ